MRRQLAALDLGSNSFHLLVVNERDGHIQVVDKYREMVRLAAGLDEDSNLTEETETRALNCLERLAERLRGLQEENVRIVGTSALRQAKNSAKFIEKAGRVLGHPIELIGGREEARLIYLGVSHSLEDNNDRRLVVDIGGGSTELIIGSHFEPDIMESVHMGCVAMSSRCFPDGKTGRRNFELAVNLGRQELEPVSYLFHPGTWETAIGASGTVLAIEEVLSGNGFPHGVITAEGLEWLIGRLIEARQIDLVDLPQLSAERAPVFCGGVAILAAVFAELDISFMHASTGALREGLIHDILGRVHRADIREATVASLRGRYHIEPSHTDRVRDLVVKLHAQVAKAWKLADADDVVLLRWAVDLHEIGMDISHSQYHKHGSYLLLNMDMPGFSKRDQSRLATLVRSHRRKIPADLFTGEDAQALLRLTVLLRLAVVFRRSRQNDEVPDIHLKASDEVLQIMVPSAWLDQHPLTRLDLKQEIGFLSHMPIGLKVIET
ncbi:MAG: Ppx/GppA family phosphatase [Gammaproteobacteria bacterium]|nr:Ppx/GppA family phosphatase [Gammaproteobacteria bacterium]